MVENAGQIFRSDSDAVVDDGNGRPPDQIGHAQRDLPVRARGFVTGVLGVAYEVHEDLQDFVLVEVDHGVPLEVTQDFDAVTRERTRIQAQAVLHEIDDVEDLLYAGDFRITLLHRHDVLDVIDVPPQGLQFLHGRR